MKAVVAAFNQEKALVGAISVITNLGMELFKALLRISGKHVKIIYWAIREIYSSIYSFGRRIHWIGRIDTEAFSKEDWLLGIISPLV